MGILVSDILLRLDDLLSDEDRIRWPLAERLRWINDAPAAVLARKPSALSRRSLLVLVAGTFQTISDQSTVLLDVVRNMGTTGTTPGIPVRRTDRQQLDDIDPDWHTGKPKAVIRQFTFDDRLPKSFYCYPPAIAGTQVEIIDAVLPAAVTTTTDTLDIGAEYMDPLVNYVVYRANSKDNEYSNGAVAGAYYQAFEASLGVKAASDVAASPNQVNNSV